MGFTLVEVMVVISILIMMGAIVLPIYRSARSEAIKADCFNRMRQIGYGMTVYRDDWGGMEIGTPTQMGFPPTFFTPQLMASALGGG